MQKIDLRGANFCTTSALLTATGAETVYDTTVTLNYVQNGKISTKTAITDGATPTTDIVTAAAITMIASQIRVVVWGLIGTTVRVIAGPVCDWDGTTASPMPQFPDMPDTFCPFAYQVLKTASTAGTITFGSSNWNATGFTNAIVNVAVLPDRPQTS